MKFIGNTEEYLFLKTIDGQSCDVLTEHIESSLTILWFQAENNILIIDGKEEVFSKDQIVFLTEFHQIVPKKIGETRFLRFNRPFYCILDHDSEVGCKGILFFGASQLPVITISTEEHQKFDILWQMFVIEMESNDNLQIDMLQMMLKRYLILCARRYKNQENYPNEKSETDLVREYNFLVEQHFRTKHSVADYAELLFKSPKTISNIFSKMDSKSPLKYIHERIMLEARRTLYYTDKSVKEIAYELGFEDIQAFSRFFKKQEGVSPTEYKGKRDLGTIANS
ncbi:helix-turn-helix domain-containing protein [Arenibacter sp. F20364]|uniref:helix-turn-helix domain-containing protein n=1 Tax=Arenibacter sp. F20364 TaxID=2926415 RepID=UPI001FF2FFAE|nr:helix-turn-helix domain-containing protein [Arenibacter sp. F20364]MCK0189184.1 helix-turn-helix domain-containing protein [Arenibacter sp. F20364]